MKVLRYAVHRQRPTGFLGAFLGTSRVETDTGVAHNALIDLAPRPGLEPGTCGLTVRPVIPRKTAPDNDSSENGR